MEIERYKNIKIRKYRENIEKIQRKYRENNTAGRFGEKKYSIR